MFKNAACIFLLVGASAGLKAQTTFLPLDKEVYHLLDRLETRSGNLSKQFSTSVKPIARAEAVSFLLEMRSMAREIDLSTIDRYHIDHAISVSGEWVPDGDGALPSRRPIFRTFYKTQPNFVHVHTGDFFLAANPVMSLELFSEKQSRGQTKTKYYSSRGLELRGRILDKIGFYTYITDNQEQAPEFENEWIDHHRAIPGVDFFTRKKDHYDYMQARGYINFPIIQDHLRATFGYDQQFLGDGIRSLFLSDFAPPSVFLKLDTRIWKIQYQNLFMELTPQFTKSGGDHLLPHKYATIHTLNVSIKNWLSVGFFESVMFSRQDKFEFGYMIPLIFYRAIERGLGSPDNVSIGFNFKAIAAKRFQFYGQFVLDEFTAKELFGSKGYWGNKYGLQLGIKYFDAFGLSNLDIQGEINQVRPYTYAHYDTTSNYTHYNQPLAHPLGASFREWIGVVKYQPLNKLYLSLTGRFYQKGVDTGQANYGGDPFKNYTTRSQDYGISMINGVKTTCASLNLQASYELKENLFLDLGLLHRAYRYDAGLYPTTSTTLLYGGVRLNVARRNYDFY